MGIFDFFKKKSVEEKIEIGSFEDAEKVFGEKVGALKKREEEVLFEIGEKFEDFYVSVEGKLGVLEGIDIEGKKEYKRAKILVRQGLDKYVGFVRGLLKDLRGLEGGDLGKFVREVGRVFVGFERTSSKVYERATYLIGDEMMAVRNEIRKFYNGLLGTFEEEKLLIGDLKRVGDIELKLGEIERVEGKLKDFEEEIRVNDVGIGRAKGKFERLNREVGEIKDSSEYVLRLKMKEEIGVLEVGLNSEIVKLKNLVDFKKLIGIVHSSERDLRIVKGFRDSFVSEFSRGGERLLGLLEESGMRGGEIEAQVSLIGKKKEELVEKRKGVGLDVSVAKLEEIKKVEGEIEVMEIGNVKVRRRLREFGLRLEGLREGVVGLVGGMGESL
jgi:hypothetical protein